MKTKARKRTRSLASQAATDFWGNIVKDTRFDCWLWQGPFSNGYGIYRANGRYEKAHRTAYELATGKSIGSDHIYHRCINKTCINPEHLYPTPCQPHVCKGEHNGMSKLSWEKVHYIRREYQKENVTLEALAVEFNVSTSCIYKVLKGITWFKE
jgi:hypothetical protein